MSASSPVPFALVGVGWRAEFFLRIARALPHRFTVSEAVVRDPAKARAFERRWGVPARPDIASLDPAASRFAVLCVPADAAPDAVAALAERGVPVLMETPPAPNFAGLERLWALAERGATIDVAEQYPVQPLHAARLAWVRSGRIGLPSFAHVSEAHGYHGVALIRAFLGGVTAPATVTARRFAAPVVAGPDRDGPPREERIIDSPQTIAHLNFDGRMGVYDFAGEQYFSWIRSRSVLVRGERGELRDRRLSFLRDAATPVHLDLRREDAGAEGNLEGLWHRGYLAGENWAYRNPFPGAALSDDEIAVATCILAAARGETGYGLAAALEDQTFALGIAEAASTGAAVEVRPGPWTERAGAAATGGTAEA